MTALAQTDADPWKGILNENEEIIWQGAPDPGFRINAGDLMQLVFGCIFAGFSVFWMASAAQAGGFFWMFGLLFFFVGWGVVLNAAFGNTLLRRNSFYTLTNQRAFIATHMPFRGKKLESYPINTVTPLSLQSGTFDTINFATREVHNKNGSHRVHIGFQDIDDGRRVFQMMSRIQKGDAP